MPRIRSHDQGFVGAPPAQVYEVLADLHSYPAWWPGTEESAEGIGIPLRRSPARMTADRHRNHVGLHLVSRDEDLEWYLEPFDDGAIVNVFLEIDAHSRRAPRRLLAMRGAIRRGLVGLKRRLEGSS